MKTDGLLNKEAKLKASMHQPTKYGKEVGGSWMRGGERGGEKEGRGKEEEGGGGDGGRRERGEIWGIRRCSWGSSGGVRGGEGGAAGKAAGG